MSSFYVTTPIYYVNAAPRIGASNDFFIRTTDPEHMVVVQDVLTRVRERA